MEKVRGVFREKYFRNYPIEISLMKSESTEVEKPQAVPMRKSMSRANKSGSSFLNKLGSSLTTVIKGK